jgi:hypothetical protein
MRVLALVVSCKRYHTQLELWLDMGLGWGNFVLRWWQQHWLRCWNQCHRRHRRSHMVLVPLFWSGELCTAS